MNIPITYQEGIFSFSPGGTLEDFATAVTAALRATVPGDNFILGHVGGPQPTDGTLWFTNGSFNYYSGSTYRPTLVKIGNATNQITLTANPTSNRTQTLQDKDGTIALTSDIHTPRPTIILLTTTPTIDWSQSNSFYETIGQSITVDFINSLPGQEIDLIVNSIASGKTVTLPSNVVSVGALSAQTSPGTDRYRFTNVAGQIYVEKYTNYT